MERKRIYLQSPRRSEWKKDQSRTHKIHKRHIYVRIGLLYSLMVVDASFPIPLKRRKFTSIDSMEAETAKVLSFFFFPWTSPFARFSWFLIYVLVQIFVFDIGSIWVLSKMVYLCFNSWILEDSGCGFGASIVCVFQIGVVLFLLFRFL